jgi:probable phosphoglycerate mutase
MPASTTICLARHGETDWNTAGILQGWIDVAINDTGRRQAGELADKLAACSFSRIYTSPLVRASETADIISARLGLGAPDRLDGLKERNFGNIQGIPKAELAELNPVLYQQILKRNPACDFDEGETMDEFASRVLAAIVQIACDNGDAHVLVITHGWVMDVVTRHVGNLPRSAILPVKRKNMECLWLEADPAALRALPATPGVRFDASS